MATAIEIHGFKGCPFAWRVRLTATLKGAPFEWLPCDAEPADPRCATHNPDRRSPLLYDDGFTLTESGVILAYLDESRKGPHLQASDPKARALARLAIAELASLMLRIPMQPPQTREKVNEGLGALDRHLADGRPFLDGDEPGLADVHVWTALATLEPNGIPITGAASAAYWRRSRAHPAFVGVAKPTWVTG